MSGTVEGASASQLSETSQTTDRGERARSEPRRCLMCGGNEHGIAFTELGIDILRCKTCGHVFSSYRAEPHFAGYWGEQVAAGEHYYWSKARARMHRDFFDRFIAGRSGRLLDMGSGLGFFLKAMQAFPDWEAYGCEISPAAVRHAREHLGLERVICSPPQDADLPRNSFDIITLWDVLDHIPQPDPLLGRCHALLKDEGTIFIRTPNVATQLFRARVMKAIRGIAPDRKYMQASDHAHFYSMRSIRTLLERNGFRNVEFIHLHPIGGDSGRGWRSVVVTALKTTSYYLLRALATLSGGRLNFDNLFVVARKSAATRS
ncbi:MAG TPA: class I SAM-dependent methyltransferase [Hyphomicrobiaceae bacterium]|nr:class I SAM-dependent methyltransferase [Hyphomicrobiaceae bacterium]